MSRHHHSRRTSRSGRPRPFGGVVLLGGVVPGPLFLWVSPLGRLYVAKGEPIRPDLPDPDPAPPPAEESARETDRRLRRTDPRILERPAPDTPRPPPKPDPPPDEEAPF